LAGLRAPVREVQAPSDGGDLPQRFLQLLAHTIGVDGVESIDTTLPLVAIGLDSLQALEIRRRVKTEFDHDLEVSQLLGGASISDLLAQLTPAGH
jgi:mycobactin polyketide synthetase MbtD